MPSLDELQSRLSAFRAAGQNLQLEPLVTQKALSKFGVEYQTDLVDELEQAIEDCTSQDNKLIFTGHRGCGKSTLLAELNFRLLETRRYFVVMFSISDTVDESAVDHVNILFSMAIQLLEAAERRQVKLEPGIKNKLYRWLGKHTKTESDSAEATIEVSAEASAKAGIPGFLDFLAKIKSILKMNSVIREEITIEFARKISDLIAQINLIQSAIESETRQEVLVMIDDLDKLSLSDAETIFTKNIQPLLAPSFRVIYTIPVATLREVSMKRNIEAYVKKIHTMRVGKFFTKATVRSTDRIPDPEMVSFFDRVLEKRFPQSLIDPAIQQEMILKSGGVLRELIRIADSCCDLCMQQIRRQIRLEQFDQPFVKIDQAVLTSVLSDLQISYAQPLGQSDFESLIGIYQEFRPKDTENQRFRDLLHGLYVLEYRDLAAQWYDLNPIVKDLLIQEGLLDDG